MKRRRLRPATILSSRVNPRLRPHTTFRAFVMPWGDHGCAVGIFDLAEQETVGGLTVWRAGKKKGSIHAAAAVRGFGPLLYDVGAMFLGPLRRSTDQSVEARGLWAQLGSDVWPQLTPAEFEARYGVAFAALRDDAGNVPYERRKLAIEEAEEVADFADFQRLAGRKEFVPSRLPLEARWLRAREETAKPPRRPRGASRRRPARTNPRPDDVQLYVAVLAQLRALQWFYWTTHWTVGGPNFYGQHLLLERLYEGKNGGPNINEEIDQLGERIVAYFGAQAINPAAIQRTAAASVEAAQRAANPLAGLQLLEAHLQQAIKRAWDAEQRAGDERSLGLDDYLMSLAGERDTARYLLSRVLA